ncbi:MAG: hypothetical protein ABS76_15550 [Pelagibacterium sp. SCN 64-44]|nr:MAG: hypothetical protein ABS76_15550 [Pelagibacterium sp. SCN 64-44]
MLSKLKTFAALCGAFFVAVAIAFLRGRRAGVEHMEAELQARRIEAMKARKDVDDEVDQMGAADLDSNYSRWLRDDER